MQGKNASGDGKLKNSSPMTRFNLKNGGADDPENKLCRICYDVDEFAGNDWLSPCRCNGSVKWVHVTCFRRWMKSATGEHYLRCSVCSYIYQRRWQLKPLKRWTWPSIRLSVWGAVEIIIDVLGTVKMVRNTIDTIRGKRSFFVHAFSILLWRMFIATQPRITYYNSICQRLMFSVFDTRFLNVNE